MRRPASSLGGGLTIIRLTKRSIGRASPLAISRSIAAWHSSAESPITRNTLKSSSDNVLASSLDSRFSMFIRSSPYRRQPAHRDNASIFRRLEGRYAVLDFLGHHSLAVFGHSPSPNRRTPKNASCRIRKLHGSPIARSAKSSGEFSLAFGSGPAMLSSLLAEDGLNSTFFGELSAAMVGTTGASGAREGCHERYRAYHL
jgi:hypothetical protein